MAIKETLKCQIPAEAEAYKKKYNRLPYVSCFISFALARVDIYEVEVRVTGHLQMDIFKLTFTNHTHF